MLKILQLFTLCCCGLWASTPSWAQRLPAGIAAVRSVEGIDEYRLGNQHEQQYTSRQSTECGEQQRATAQCLSLAADPWCR